MTHLDLCHFQMHARAENHFHFIAILSRGKSPSRRKSFPFYANACIPITTALTYRKSYFFNRSTPSQQVGIPQLPIFFVLSPRYADFFMDTLPAKKRSLLAMGPPDSGKSFFGALARRQLPRSRVFLPLSTSEFCWNDLDEKMHLVGYANDWRFSPSLPVQPCLNWLEDLEFR